MDDHVLLEKVFQTYLFFVNKRISPFISIDLEMDEKAT